jgi:hypothetical protein
MLVKEELQVLLRSEYTTIPMMIHTIPYAIRPLNNPMAIAARDVGLCQQQMRHGEMNGVQQDVKTQDVQHGQQKSSESSATFTELFATG